MADGERRVSTIHQSLTRPVLLAGAERPLAIANWITAAALILGSGLHWYTILIGVLLVTVGHWGSAGAGGGYGENAAAGGRHGLPSMRPHRTVKAFSPCLRAVSM